MYTRPLQECEWKISSYDYLIKQNTTFLSGLKQIAKNNSRNLLIFQNITKQLQLMLKFIVLDSKIHCTLVLIAREIRKCLAYF